MSDHHRPRRTATPSTPGGSRAGDGAIEGLRRAGLASPQEDRFAQARAHVASLQGVLPDGTLIAAVAETLREQGWRVHAAHLVDADGMPARALIVRRSDLGADRWAVAPVGWRSEATWHLAADTADGAEQRTGLFDALVDDLIALKPLICPTEATLLAMPEDSLYGMQAAQAAMVDAWCHDHFPDTHTESAGGPTTESAGGPTAEQVAARVHAARTMLALVLPAHLMARLAFTREGRPIICGREDEQTDAALASG